MITKLDRLVRSVRSLTELAADLEARGVGQRVLDQGIDTTTLGGRLFVHIIASIAEFERDLISERTHDGLAASRARGRKGGRRPKLSDKQIAQVRKMHGSGEHTIADIAATFNVTRSTIYRALETEAAAL